MPVKANLCVLLLLTPWSRFLLKKLKGCQLVKKFPTFYGTQRFIAAVTIACHLSLSEASSIQSTPPHPTSWRSILCFTVGNRKCYVNQSKKILKWQDSVGAFVRMVLKVCIAHQQKMFLSYVFITVRRSRKTYSAVTQFTVWEEDWAWGFLQLCLDTLL